MIKVFTKGAALNCLFQITIRCGDDSHIDGDGLIPAHAFELSRLEKSEKLGLELLGDIAHLVQDNRAPVRHFHLGSFELLCAGESAFLVPTPFAFQKLFGESYAVDRQKATRFTITTFMNRAVQ